MRSGDSTNIVGKDVAAFSASSDMNIDVVSRCGIFEAGALAAAIVSLFLSIKFQHIKCPAQCCKSPMVIDSCQSYEQCFPGK